MRAGLLVNSVDQATWHVVHHWGKYHYETFNSEEAARTYYAKLGDGMSRGLWRNANLMDAWAYDDGWANNIRNHFKEVIGAMEPNTRSHPLADKTMLILKAEDGSCLSFRSSDSCLRTSYTNPDDFMPVKFCAVQGRPGVYILQNLYEGNDGQAYINSWIAVDTSEDERGYFYVRTNTKSQATPLEFVELPEQKGAYKIINRTSGVPKLGVEFIDDWLYTQDNHWLSIGASADQATTFLLKPCVGWMYDFAGTKFAIHEDMSLSIQNVPVELSSTDNGCLRLAKVSRSNNQKETLQGCVEAHHACYKKLTAEVAQLQLQITKLENDLDTKLDLSQEAEETLDNEARALRRQKRKVRKELQRMDAMKTISISYNEVTTGVSVTLAPGQSVQPSFLSRPVVFFRAATVTEQPVSETSIKTEYASL